MYGIPALAATGATMKARFEMRLTESFLTRGISRTRIGLGSAALVVGAIALGASPLSGNETLSASELDRALAAAAHAGPAADAVTIDWKVLGGLNYLTGEKTETLEQLHGKQVRVPGFIVPLDDFAEEVTEFLLVPYFGACVHVPPPPPNQMVYVTMKGGKKHKIGWWDPVYIEGTLTIEQFDSAYGAAGFQMEVEKVTEYGK